MKLKYSIALFSIVLGTAALSLHEAALGATTAIGQSPNSAVSVILAPVGDAGSGHAARYKFGTVLVVDTADITHVFKFQNTSQQSVIVERTEPSCSCTSAEIIKSPVQEANPVVPIPGDSSDPQAVDLAPGDTVSIKVDVDASELMAGDITKSVLLFVTGQDVPAAEMIMQGTIDRGIDFDKSFIDFGTLKSTDIVSQTVAVTIDRRLETGGAVVKIVSKDPAISVSEMGLPEPEHNEPVAAHPLRKSQLKVTLDHPFIGSLGSMNSALVAERTKNGVTTTVPDVELDLVGNVTGTFSASSRMVLFPTGPDGTQGPQKITLTADAPGALDGLTATSASPFVRVKIEPRKSKKATDLVMSLVAGTPEGSLQSSVIIKNDTGERMKLPIYTYVVGNKRNRITVKLLVYSQRFPRVRLAPMRFR